MAICNILRSKEIMNLFQKIINFLNILEYDSDVSLFTGHVKFHTRNASSRYQEIVTITSSAVNINHPRSTIIHADIIRPKSPFISEGVYMRMVAYPILIKSILQPYFCLSHIDQSLIDVGVMILCEYCDHQPYTEELMMQDELSYRHNGIHRILMHDDPALLKSCHDRVTTALRILDEIMYPDGENQPRSMTLIEIMCAYIQYIGTTMSIAQDRIKFVQHLVQS